MPAQLSDHIDSPEAFGERLRARRLMAEITQADLAEGLCTIGYISRLESGLRVPSLQIVRHLASRLQVDETWLATGGETPAGQPLMLEPGERATLIASLSLAAYHYADPSETLALLRKVSPRAGDLVAERRAELDALRLKVVLDDTTKGE